MGYITDTNSGRQSVSYATAVPRPKKAIERTAAFGTASGTGAFQVASAAGRDECG